MAKNSDRTAMIFAAGLGTRLKPITDSMPKALVMYKGVPLLEQVINRLKLFGFTKIVINVHHFADMIEDFVFSKQFGIEIFFSDERDLLRETGGGIKHIEKFFLDGCIDNQPFLVHNVDIISNIDINWLYEKWDENYSTLGDRLIATLLVSDRKTSRYLLFDEDDRLVGWTNIDTGEVKSPFGELDVSKYRKSAFGGIHILSPKVFDLMKGWNERFSIIDFYLSIADKYVIKGCIAPEGASIVDVGKISQL